MKAFLLILAVSGTLFAANAQDVKTILLKQQHVSFAPKGYYISDVADDRPDNSIGTLNEGGSSKRLVLQNGAGVSIKSFIERNVSQDKGTQPIVLHISKIDIAARKTGATSQVEGSTTFAFYAAGKRVAEYSGKGRGQVDADPADFIESFIRKAVENDLKEFDNWWAQHRGEIATADAVKVNVTIGRTTDKPNMIVYSLHRPLSIADFEGPAEGQIQEMAATYSGIGMGYTSQTQNGQVVLNVTVTPYFDRSGSWFKEEGKNARVLAHEQAHFDITGIKACELAEAIRNASFTQENYEKLMTELQKQNNKDANEEEALYDSETNHGIIEDKQIEWQNRLKQKVREIGCY